MEAIDMNAICLPHLPSILKNNKNIILKAIRKNPFDIKLIKDMI